MLLNYPWEAFSSISGNFHQYSEKLLSLVRYFLATVEHFFIRLFEIHYTLGLFVLVLLCILMFSVLFFSLLVILPIFIIEEMIVGHFANAGVAFVAWFLLMCLYYREKSSRRGPREENSGKKGKEAGLDA
jgi:hypothetical protein